jgi:hypothetical protein
MTTFQPEYFPAYCGLKTAPGRCRQGRTSSAPCDKPTAWSGAELVQPQENATESLAPRARESEVAAGTTAVSARNQPARHLCGWRRARRQRQASSVRGRRRIDCCRVCSSSASPVMCANGSSTFRQHGVARNR